MDNSEKIIPRRRVDNSVSRLNWIVSASSFRNLLIGLVFAFLGMGLKRNIEFYNYRQWEDWFFSIGIYDLANILLVVGASLIFFEYYNLVMRYIKGKNGRDFIDIDMSQKQSISVYNNEKLANEIQQLKQVVNKLQKNNSNINEAEVIQENNITISEDFISYVHDIRRTLDERIQNLDAKASIMLDKGTSYAKWGIGIYLTSIITWQIWIAYLGRGITSEHIIGIVSGSVLFIFIEFLSAWFMKQHQHFIDTSTYLGKIKSIFDKHMLAFLALKDLTNKNNVNNELCERVLDLLGKDIKWPDDDITYDKKYVGFAKDAMESLVLAQKELSKSLNYKKREEIKD